MDRLGFDGVSGETDVACRLPPLTMAAIMNENRSTVRSFQVTRMCRRPALMLWCLALLGGCTNTDGSVGDNLLTGISEGITNLAAHLVEALLLNLFI